MELITDYTQGAIDRETADMEVIDVGFCYGTMCL